MTSWFCSQPYNTNVMIFIPLNYVSIYSITCLIIDGVGCEPVTLTLSLIMRDLADSFTRPHSLPYSLLHWYSLPDSSCASRQVVPDLRARRAPPRSRWFTQISDFGKRSWERWVILPVLHHDAITVPYSGVQIVLDNRKPLNDTTTISLIYANQRFLEEDLIALGDTPSASPRRDHCAVQWSTRNRWFA